MASRISSFGFSGAGFLACYHLGVAQCLLDQRILTTFTSSSQSRSIALTGVSAGALISAALAAGVQHLGDDGMHMALQVSRQARAAGRLDALQPGFSLIDVVEEHFAALLRQAVVEPEQQQNFLQRIEHGKLLRIGLTDRREFFPFPPTMIGRRQKNKNNNSSRAAAAFCYVDQYRDIEDVIAACMLSSYIPALTGPAWGSLDTRHGAIARATRHLQDMIRAGCVKKGATGEPVQLSRSEEEEEEQQGTAMREICWDGGLVNAFPFIDEDTVIVSPLAADFHHNKSINPSLEYGEGESVRYLQLNNSRVRLHLTSANALAFRHITISSDDKVLQEKFAQGYDNAHHFLSRHNMLSVFHSHSSASSSASV